jgi:hypothetical protein
MSYPNFTALQLKEKFGVAQSYQERIFGKLKPQSASDWLKLSLKQGVEFALEQGSEKARSEFIIAPVFIELRNLAEKKISIFSGIEFNVDRKLGFTGWCDFLVSRSSFQRALEAPVVIAVEAKQQNFEKGIDQCIAEMIAAQIFNEKRGNNIDTIYGCVTTGDAWRFLLLKDKQALIDTTVFDVGEDLERILGILHAMAMNKVESKR